eukprot:1138490-Pelagomonas_calceolata.AAC.5
MKGNITQQDADAHAQHFTKPTRPADEVLVVESVHHCITHSLISQEDQGPCPTQRAVSAGQATLQSRERVH